MYVVDPLSNPVGMVHGAIFFLAVSEILQQSRKASPLSSVSHCGSMELSHDKYGSCGNGRLTKGFGRIRASRLVTTLLLVQPNWTHGFVPDPRRTPARIPLFYRNAEAAAAVSIEPPSPTSPPLVKHPHFKHHNTDTKWFPLPPDAQEAWDGIVPKADLASFFGIGVGTGGQSTRRGVLGANVLIEFDDPNLGAAQLLEGCGILSVRNDYGHSTAQQHLVDVLTYYQELVSYGAKSRRRCRARIVASRGTIGVKCPRWHLDHVPVRLVMSLVGSGCIFIPESLPASLDTAFVDREALNSLDVEDSEEANRIIVPDERGAVRASVGQGVVLMGREWDTVDKDGGPEEENAVLHAAAHKSPKLSLFEGRILLTVDIAFDSH